MTESRTYPQRARERIAATKIIDRLIGHVNGEIDMTPTQVRAASILLNKVLPDLKSVEVDAYTRLKTMPISTLTDEQLIAIIAGGDEKGAIEGKAERVQEPLQLAVKK